jgi:uncharacterized protein (UPF0297 family)
LSIDTLRKKLHALIDKSTEEKLKEVYTILEGTDYAGEFNKELEEEYTAYENNDTIISKEEMDKLVEELILKIAMSIWKGE